MTLLGPLLIAAFYALIFYISFSELSKSKARTIYVFDPKNSMEGALPATNSNFKFEFVGDTGLIKRDLDDEGGKFLMIVGNSRGDSMQLIGNKGLSITDKQALKELVSEHYFTSRLRQKGLSANMIDSMHMKIYMNDELLSGKSSGIEVKSMIGYIGAFVIYLFIFMYGVMIMRGVTEEKNNRIVEIIVSAVKPFELMMGKILGVAMVGLTQFIAWILLSGLFLTLVSVGIGSEFIQSNDIQNISQSMPRSGADGISEFINMSQLQSLNFPKIFVGFILFFIGGFLLYSSLFAAIGSAVDSDTETQQFMMPISMPLIFGLVIAQIAVIKDPNSSLAIWSSMIPFTSPVVMMVRMPFDISWGEIAISAVLLFGTFLLVVWVAAKIYRIGILSYGQKASYKQIFKWLMSKN